MLKSITLMVLLCAFITGFSQNIKNTKWQTYNGTLTDTITVDIGNDSIYQYVKSDSILVTSYFIQDINLVTLVDFFGPLACPSTDTGLYAFTITNDTLKVALISDPCFQRNLAYNGVELWRVKESTSVVKVNRTDKLLKVYPNPSNGPLNIKAEEDGFIHVFNVEGQMMLPKSPVVRGQILHLNLNQGSYFIQYTSENNYSVHPVFIL